MLRTGTSKDLFERDLLEWFWCKRYMEMILLETSTLYVWYRDRVS